MQRERAIVSVKESGKKIDKFVRQQMKDISFNVVSRMLRKGQIKVNGKRQKNSYVVEAGDVVEIYGQFESHNEKEKKFTKHHITLSKNLQVFYMDDDILIINKPSGLAVQGGSKISVSLDDLAEFLKFELENKPKLVHRIDRDTSGVLIMARNYSTARTLSKMFQDSGTIKKHYLAICNGYPKKLEGTISIPLAKVKLNDQKEVMSYSSEEGNQAITHYKVLKHNRVASLIQFEIVTGRTHQVRAHAAISGIPLVGDLKYDRSYSMLLKRLLMPKERELFILQNSPSSLSNEKKIFLHSESVEFEFKNSKIAIKAPLPQAFLDGIKRIIN